MKLAFGAVALFAAYGTVYATAAAATRRALDPPVKHVAFPYVGVTATSASMEPTIHCASRADPHCRSTSSPDLSLVELSGAKGVERGDIVSFRAPASADRVCRGGGTLQTVKRVIGLGGDEIIEKNGIVFVDGRRQQEPYVPAAERDHISGHWRVAKGSFFVMGDDRRISCDSRYWGPVADSQIAGRVVEIVRPTKGGSDPVGPPVVRVRVAEAAYEVTSPAMEPTLRCRRQLNPAACTARAGDLARVSLSGERRLHRGDVVAFRLPPAASRFCGTGGALERLIGLGGDYVREDGGRVTVNGRTIDDSYVPPAERDHRSGSWFVPRHAVFVMADYRSRACDSRRFGPVPLTLVRGRVTEIIRPA